MSISEKEHDSLVDASLDDVLTKLLDRFGTDVHAKVVFGDALEHEGVQVIPVARASWGVGTGRRRGGAESSRDLGGGMRVSPVGYIEFTESGVRFQPIRPWWVEFTYVLGAGLLGLLFLRRRPRR